MTEVGGAAAIFDPLDEKMAAECLAENLRDTKTIVEAAWIMYSDLIFQLSKKNMSRFTK
jgi:hypothetical protein